MFIYICNSIQRIFALEAALLMWVLQFCSDIFPNNKEIVVNMSTKAEQVVLCICGGKGEEGRIHFN